jgi:hypothetical protein
MLWRAWGQGGIIAWLWEVATDIRGNFNGRCARAEGESQPESSGRVIDRALILRGFIECGLKRGAWRLTALGVKVAKVLHPEARPLKTGSGQDDRLTRRAALGAGPRARQRPRAMKASLPANKRVGDRDPVRFIQRAKGVEWHFWTLGIQRVLTKC